MFIQEGIGVVIHVEKNGCLYTRLRCDESGGDIVINNVSGVYESTETIKIVGEIVFSLRPAPKIAVAFSLESDEATVTSSHKYELLKIKIYSLDSKCTSDLCFYLDLTKKDAGVYVDLYRYQNLLELSPQVVKAPIAILRPNGKIAILENESMQMKLFKSDGKKEVFKWAEAGIMEFSGEFKEGNSHFDSKVQVRLKKEDEEDEEDEESEQGSWDMKVDETLKSESLVQPKKTESFCYYIIPDVILEDDQHVSWSVSGNCWLPGGAF